MVSSVSSVVSSILSSPPQDQQQTPAFPSLGPSSFFDAINQEPDEDDPDSEPNSMTS